MKFWDSSAVVPLLLAEAQSERLVALLRADAEALMWWGTPVECTSAIARRERDGMLSLDVATAALARMRDLERGWTEVAPGQAVRATARRLLRVHPLRAADALQLAAALVVAGPEPGMLEFVCLDERLAAAAQREGLRLVR